MHSRLEAYLSEVSAHLGALPGKRRDEELREMRAHLEATYAAGLSRGQSEDEAAREAFAQFGTPEELGLETVAAWKRGQDLDRRSLWGAAACALVLMFLLPRLMQPLETLFPRQFVWKPFSLTAFFVFFGGAIFLMTGAVTGLFFPRRTVAGIGLAWSAHLVWMLVYVMPQMRHEDHGSLLTRFHSFLFWAALYGLFCPLGVWAVSRWRTTRVGRVRMAR